jgi:hypothetical protein
MQSLWYTEQELGDQNFQNGRAEFKTKVDMSKKECIEAMPPHTYSVQF